MSESPLRSDQAPCLTFYSWWYEDNESTDLTFRVSSASEVGGGLQRRYCTLTFDIATSSFSITSLTDLQTIKVSGMQNVTDVRGRPVGLYDLHVGATLVVLGRRMSLLKANLKTVQWNEAHAKGLLKHKADLLNELQLYKPRAHKAAVTFSKTDQVANGGLMLKHTVQQILALLEDLRQYRPDRADQLQAKLGKTFA